MTRRCYASVFHVVVGVAILLSIACDRAIAPRRNRLTELRQEATSGFGVFYGRVRAFDPTQSCWKTGRNLGGIRVEVGLWAERSAFYRDTITHTPPTNLEDSRFELSHLATALGRQRMGRRCMAHPQAKTCSTSQSCA